MSGEIEILIWYWRPNVRFEEDALPARTESHAALLADYSENKRERSYVFVFFLQKLKFEQKRFMKIGIIILF